LNTFYSRLIHEPLVHFLVLGAGLFVLYGYVGDTEPERADRVVVEEADVTRLAEQFQRTWMRPPTRAELEGLAEDFVEEEILYREALALELDKNDLIIRRRMRQKIEFLNADLVEQAEPTDDELQTYLEANPEKFEVPSRYSFQQIYLNPEASSDHAEKRAAAVLAELQADPWLGADPQSLGDATLLPTGLESASRRMISSVFGAGLADAVAGAEMDVWTGPYDSSYGLHLILLTEKEEGGLPPFEQIRPTVEREWSNERRQEANERFYRALRERYSIEIRLPDPDPAPDGDSLAARAQ
jgi:hypothetical protein